MKLYVNCQPNRVMAALMSRPANVVQITETYRHQIWIETVRLQPRCYLKELNVHLWWHFSTDKYNNQIIKNIIFFIVDKKAAIHVYNITQRTSSSTQAFA